MSYCDTCGHQFSDVCGTCETLDGVPVKYEKKTNADRIRDVICNIIRESLSTEIIAHSIVEQMLSKCPDGRIYRETECDVLSCYDCWLEWLKEEI